VAGQFGFNSGSKDVTSMVQLNLHQASEVTRDLRDLTQPFLATGSQSCTTACGSVACNLTRIREVDTIAEMNAIDGVDCLANVVPLPEPWSPAFLLNVGCILNPNPETITCEEPAPTPSPENGLQQQPQRVCACLSSGDDNGDPHIHSLRGAHYTLLQQGVFVAWNFSKAVPGAAPAARGWQLLAAYGGDRFVTQGLVLVDRHSEQSMEITAEDCSWRVKDKTSPWRKAEVEVLSAEDGTTSLQVKKLHEKSGGTKMLRSAIMLQMESGSGMNNIGELAVHCRPGNRLDFKMTMFQKSDIDHVGGELGVAPNADHSYHFLFSKKDMVHMRADQEFKAAGSWVTLGGSPAGAAYVEKKHQAGASLAQWQGCSDAQEEDARTTCSKHIQEMTQPEIFSDCVFDMCRGGDESFAESVAEFFMQTSST